MSEFSPRHTVKARRKQKLGDSPTATSPISGDDLEWRRKYEIAVRKRRGAISSSSGGGGGVETHTPLSPSSPSSPSSHNTSQADMDFILAPTCETYDTAEQTPLSVSSNYSADSILRRVEAEIASARKAANFIKTSGQHNPLLANGNFSPQNGSREDDDDMAQILNTDTFQSLQPSISSADDSSKNRALDLIRDEFRDELISSMEVGFEVETNKAAPVHPNHLYFTDEEWQTIDGPSDGLGLTVRDEKKEEMPEKSFHSTVVPVGPKNSPKKRTPNEKSYPRLVPLHERGREASLPGRLETNHRPLSNDPSPHRQSKLPFDTPTRSNVRQRNIHPSSPQSARNDLTESQRDPDGEYEASPTPPRLALLQPTSSLAKIISPKNASPAMARTRELLESLKEQRESIVGPIRSSNNLNSSTSRLPASPIATITEQEITVSSPRGELASPTSPRSPNHCFTRATKAKERVKTSSRSRAVRDEQKSDITLQRQRNDLSVLIPPLNADAKHSSRILDMREVKEDNVAEQLTQQQKLSSGNAVEQVKRVLPQDNLNSSSDLRIEGSSPIVLDKVVAEASRRLRFRNPFPVIKPPLVRRDLEAIIQEHALNVPEIPIRWVKPKKELKQLIVAAMGTSLPRRSNACGALKVLTRHAKNQMSLVRTDGFLSAVMFAASQSVLDVDTDLAIDARTRAVACLKNVCGPKENRVVVFHHPGVVECLVKVVRQDAGEGRSLAAAAIALLAKTPACREGLAQVEGLIDIFSRVMLSAATLISEEALAVRTNPSHRSGKKMDDSVSEVSFRTGADRDDDSIITDSSSISSSEEQDLPSVVASKTESLKPVDSIKNQTEERHDEFINHARSNACAALLHISKQCATSHQLATNGGLLSSVTTVAREVGHPIHTKCLEIVFNLTRLPANNSILARFEGVIATLVAASNSIVTENRLLALRSLQNISADAVSKPVLATGPVLNLMTSCAMRKDPVEKETAVATLYNITTDPSSVTAITNTKNVVATLVHLAHSPDSTSEVRLLACEALATISLWLQTLAGTGKVPDSVSNVPLPSQKTSGWERWD